MKNTMTPKWNCDYMYLDVSGLNIMYEVTGKIIIIKCKIYKRGIKRDFGKSLM